MWLFFILLLNVVYTSTVKYICTIDHIVKLEPDTVVFFESPNFPRFMTKYEQSQCSMNFTKSLAAMEEDKRFVIVTPNIFCKYVKDHICHNYDFDATNISSYLFHLTDDTLAFQGFAYFDDWGDDCPLESVSRVDPFEFTDISQILVIRSTHDKFTSRKQSCLWQFRAPEDYGFKIIITSFNISKDTIFKVENTQDAIITSANVRKTYPHYTIDNYIKIYLSKSNASFMDNKDYEFEAYITIIKNNLNHVSINCTVEANGNYTLWSYWNELVFPNNARCLFTLKIMPKTEVIATIIKLKVEKNVDVINYYCCNSSVPNYNGPVNTSYDGDLAFAGDVNAEREVLWEFKSDGTVNSRGFEVEFVTKNCSCADPLVVVPCSADTHIFLMKNDVNQNMPDFYCGNLECNFTLKLDSFCNSQFILLGFSDRGYTENHDMFSIISNNMTIQGTGNRIFIPSSNENIFQAITVSSTHARYLTVYLSAYNFSRTLQIITINETKPHYFHESDLYDGPYMIVIELSSELKRSGASIIIFDFNNVHASGAFGIYSTSNLTDPFDNSKCFVSDSNGVDKCKTNLESFTLINYGFVQSFFLFQVTYGVNILGDEGCVFKDNVFRLNDDADKVFSAMSNSRRKCKIFLNSNGYIYIGKIWFSPHSNGSLSIFSGPSEKLLVDIDAASSFIWHDLLLYKNFYIMEIPLNSIVLLTCYYNPSDVSTNITSDSYNTIIASPKYGVTDILSDLNDNFWCGTNPFRTLDIFDNEIKVTILDMDILPLNYFYFHYNGTYTNITTETYTIEVGPPSVDFYCTCYSIKHCSIRMLVETYNSIELSTVTNTTAIPSSSKTTPLSTTLTVKERSCSFIATVNYLLIFIYCIL